MMNLGVGGFGGELGLGTIMMMLGTARGHDGAGDDAEAYAGHDSGHDDAGGSKQRRPSEEQRTINGIEPQHKWLQI